MLRAKYDNNSYTFYVTLKDTYTYTTSIGFLFKFTNDMSGAVKWGYGQNVVNTDRYTQLTIFSTKGGTVAEDVIGGVVNFEPNGYWKYEIYLTGYYPTIPCGGIDPTENGTWKCTDTGLNVIDSGSLNVDVEEIKRLTADTYTINDYDTCNPTTPFYDELVQVITNIDCITLPPRMFYFTRVVRNTTTNTFYLDSVADIGTYIKIHNSNKTYIHTITSNPENIVLNIATNDTYTFEHYSSANVLLDTYNPITTLQSLSNNYIFRASAILCSNNEYVDNDYCDNGLPYLGSIFFAYNATGNFTADEAHEGPLELGKLYVEEQVGEEQVQYTEHESPPSTNYIYND